MVVAMPSDPRAIPVAVRGDGAALAPRVPRRAGLAAVRDQDEVPRPPAGRPAPPGPAGGGHRGPPPSPAPRPARRRGSDATWTGRARHAGSTVRSCEAP